MVACRGETTPPDDLGGSSGAAETGAADGSSGGEDTELVTYENFGDAFIRNWCRGCHSSELTGDARSGAPEGIDFDDRDDVEALADRIEARASGDSPTMPPAGGPSPEELDLLEQWLAAGVP
ncbi:MAG: hypothetical protein AAF799_06620 [Myxococcota bacterium]